MVCDDDSLVFERRRAFYTRIYRQTYSPEGDWLLASDNRSRLCLFSVPMALSAKSALSYGPPYRKKPLQGAVKVPSSVTSLCHLTPNILLCGTENGQILGYSWKGLVRVGSQGSHGSGSTSQSGVAEVDLKPEFAFTVPGGDALSSGGDVLMGGNDAGEVNTIVKLRDGDETAKVAYAGAMDFGIRVVDAERFDKVISVLSGHRSHVNELVARSEHELISASEDGTVRVWDLRTKGSSSRVIEVWQNRELKQEGEPHRGKGVCALAAEGSLMVCGGDVPLGLWHLDSSSLIKPLVCGDNGNSNSDSNDSTDNGSNNNSNSNINVNDSKKYGNVRYLSAKMNAQNILCGGTSPLLHQFSYNGSYKMSLKTSCESIYTIEENGTKMVTVGGDGPFIDSLINLGYISFSFTTSSAFV